MFSSPKAHSFPPTSSSSDIAVSKTPSNNPIESETEDLQTITQTQASLGASSTKRAEHPYHEIVTGILAYSICSGSLLLVNKIVMHNLPYPALVSCMQFLFASLVGLAVKYCDLVPVDDYNPKVAKMYSIYVAMFVLTIYANMKTLQTSNVETIICFRTLCPILVALLDYLFMGRKVPETRSLLALSAVVFGSILYVYFDESYVAQGFSAYYWSSIYVFVLSMEMVYGKHVTSGIKLKSMWAPVIYTNIIGLVPMLAIAFHDNDFKDIDSMISTIIGSPKIFFFAFLSCVAGTGISFAGFYCRHRISATSFTLVGVLNKFLTIGANYMYWDHHAGSHGIIGVLICLLAGTQYKQAPLRDNRNDDFVQKKEGSENA